MALMQLIYVSSISNISLENEIVNILESSHRNNLQNGITGILLYAGGNFLQVLEGEADTLQKTFERITQDIRHQQIIEINRELIDERDFSQWSMGFHKLSEEQINAIPASLPVFKLGVNKQAIKAHSGAIRELVFQFSLEAVWQKIKHILQELVLSWQFG